MVEASREERWSGLEAWLTVAEAATLKQVSLQAVYRALHEGRLRWRKFGHLHLVLRQDVRAWEVSARGRGRPGAAATERSDSVDGAKEAAG